MKDDRYIAEIAARLLELLHEARQISQAAFQHTVWRVRRQRPYLTTGYIDSVHRAWLGTGVQPATASGQEIVQIYRSFLEELGGETASS